MPIGYIKVTIFLDKDGNRTCASDFKTGKVCEYYRTQRFGINETCVFAPIRGKYSEQINRRGRDRTGTLITPKWCPIEEKLYADGGLENKETADGLKK